MLSQLNFHPKDSEISFTKEGHFYTIQNFKDHPISVTTLIHKFFPKFNEDEVISKMMASRNWESSKYYGMTNEEIKKSWEENRTGAADLGTNMHETIEEYININYRYPDNLYPSLEFSDEIHFEIIPSLEFQKDKIPLLPNLHTQTTEFDYFLNFIKDFDKLFPGFKFYRTEWSVFDLSKKISGNIDLIISNDDDQLIVIDWKRSKEIKFENSFQKGFEMFSHLDDCNYNHYSLQLNIYRHILETNYGKKIIGMYMVIMHPNNSDYLLFKIPFMREEMKNLWERLPL